MRSEVSVTVRGIRGVSPEVQSIYFSISLLKAEGPNVQLDRSKNMTYNEVRYDTRR